MRKTNAALLAGGIVAGGVWIASRRKRRRGPGVHRTIATLAITQMGIDWNPVSWFQSVGHIANNVVSTIENWTKNAINAAIDLYDEAINTVINDIGIGMGWIEAAAGLAEGWATDALNWINNAGNWFNSLVATWWDWIWANIVVPTINAVQDALNVAEYLLSTAISEVTGSLDWLVDNVVDPVANWVNNAENWIWQHIESWWNDVWSVTFGPILADLEWLWDNVPNWINWLVNDVYEAWQVIVQAWDWIVYAAEHPISVLEGLVTDAENSVGRSVITAMVQGDSSEFASLEQHLVNIWG